MTGIFGGGIRCLPHHSESPPSYASHLEAVELLYLKQVQVGVGSKMEMNLPWEPKTFIFRGYNPYIGG